MGISFDPENRLFFIETANTVMCLAVTDEEGFLGNVYYGKKVPKENLRYLLRTSLNPFVPSVNDRDRGCYLDKAPFEFPSDGAGDYRKPAVILRDARGCDASLFTYASHRIYEGKEELSQTARDGAVIKMPGTFAGSCTAHTLEIKLEDKALRLSAYLSYSVFDDSDAILKNVKLVNDSEETVTIEKIMSSSIDLDCSAFDGKYPDMITLSGSWARERRIDRRTLSRGVSEVSSSRGESSHQFHPFFALCEPGADDSHGKVYAQTIVWSGNFECGAAIDQFDSVRAYIGTGSRHFSWDLRPGTSFQTPEAVLVFADGGFDSMSHVFHDLFRSHLIRSPYLHRERPILINNWEATYFDFDTDKLLAIASDARDRGIEMLVMDDGWFGNRNDDNSSLGDWTVNETKLQGGIERLSDELKKTGMKFGIWFEPEMISPDSDLYRAHPDWAIAVSGRRPCRMRNQYVLDITRKEVRDYVFGCLAAVLDKADISYVKWDMNRPLSDLGSAELPAESMGRLSYLYTLGVYDLQERLLERYPELLLENCSGGGARYDAGMLYYSPQIWCSDDTDAIERLSIQAGTEMIYPLSTMGAHVSTCPNHITGRNVPFDVRAAVAMSGTFGYELDITAIPEEERAAIPEQTSIYRQVSETVREGDYYRIARAAETGYYDSWMSVSRDRSRALFTYIQCRAYPGGGSRIVKLKGLDPEKKYTLTPVGYDTPGSRFCSREKKEMWEKTDPGTVSGSVLMNAGVPVPYMHGDYGQLMLDIREA